MLTISTASRPENVCDTYMCCIVLSTGCVWLAPPRHQRFALTVSSGCHLHREPGIPANINTHSSDGEVRMENSYIVITLPMFLNILHLSKSAIRLNVQILKFDHHQHTGLVQLHFLTWCAHSKIINRKLFGLFETFDGSKIRILN